MLILFEDVEDLKFDVSVKFGDEVEGEDCLLILTEIHIIEGEQMEILELQCNHI